MEVSPEDHFSQIIRMVIHLLVGSYRQESEGRPRVTLQDLPKMFRQALRGSMGVQLMKDYLCHIQLVLQACAMFDLNMINNILFVSGLDFILVLNVYLHFYVEYNQL